MPTDQQKTGLLNEAGLPFQEFCYFTVKQNENYLAVQEVPFTHPPSQGAQLGKTGAIDILAAKFRFGDPAYFGARGSLIYLFIECKRASPNIKNWIFLKLDNEDKRLPTFFVKKSRAGQWGSLEAIRGIFPNLGYGHPEHFEATGVAIEVNSALNAWNRNQDDKIYKAALQANYGLNAIGSQLSNTVENLDIPGNVTKILYLPVVVTTANLYLANFDPSQVSKDDGAIDLSSVSYEEKPWLTYDFPLPDYLKYSSIFHNHINKNVERATTFIVNSKHWSNFLQHMDFSEWN
ncbi:MAG: hypothetical protein UY56_C0005G0047 [Parcubacteria group bacterium GW2011_GWA1_50_14]|uniref:Uncharacterized protein n=1 Tax=Candidatus Liptonbacteria bacterium GWB1_49_6 TaxID=1798644 RepID=A0A1G2C4Z9_9BACT|nr:MAG: hypothetical protein UY56_C0005G0047 [Parcubacteria group bacterium GW2011_GWA1_50_14]OGY96484.1 MAG: hypothetical protein A2122_02190 [Candidatus Liptonbacteria bacterium GWB1_49_6]